MTQKCQLSIISIALLENYIFLFTPFFGEPFITAEVLRNLKLRSNSALSGRVIPEGLGLYKLEEQHHLRRTEHLYWQKCRAMLAGFVYFLTLGIGEVNSKPVI